MSATGGAQSPAPRSASIGPGSAAMHLPPSQPQVNSGNVGAPMATGGAAPPAPISQQNLNQIVCSNSLLLLL